MVNRFASRNIYNRFRPVSLEEYLAVPVMTQKIHDQSLAAAEANRTPISALPWMEEERLRISNEMDSAIDSLTSEISERGIIDMPVQRRLTELSGKQRELFGSGSRGEELQLALKARQDYKDKLDKADGSQWWKNQQLQAFDELSRRGVDEGVYNYTGRLLSENINLQDKLLDMVDKIAVEETVNGTNWQKTSDGWYNLVTGTKTNGTPEEVYTELSRYLNQDQDVLNFLRDKASVNQILGIEQFQDDELNRNYVQNYINQQIQNAASNVTDIAQFRSQSAEVKRQNLSKNDLYGMYVQDRLNNPIFVEHGFTSNEQFSKRAIDEWIYPEQNINYSIKDSNGNAVSSGELANIILQNNKNVTSKQEALELVGMLLRGGTNQVSGSTAIAAQGVGRVTVPSGKNLGSLKDVLGINGFTISGITKAERNSLENAANAQFVNQMAEYNKTAAPGMQINNLDEYKALLKQESLKKANNKLLALHYGLQTNDVKSQEAMKGNFGVFLDRQIKMYENGKEIKMSPKELIDKMGDIVVNNGIANNPHRALTGDFVGGKVYTAQDDKGNLYRFEVEPESTSVRDSYMKDQMIVGTLQNPTFYGEGQYLSDGNGQALNFPHPLAGKHPAFPQGTSVQFAPVKRWEGQVLHEGVKIKYISPDGSTSEQEMSMEAFYRMREAQRKEMLAREYMSDKALNDYSPGL